MMGDDLTDKAGMTDEKIQKLRQPYQCCMCPKCGYSTVTGPAEPFPRVCPLCFDQGETSRMSVRDAEPWDVVYGPDAREEIGRNNVGEDVVIALREINGSLVRILDALDDLRLAQTEAAQRLTNDMLNSVATPLYDIADRVKDAALHGKES